jgi:hypothetical protein
MLFGDTMAGCRARGGAYIQGDRWIIHAWLFRRSPEGVFSEGNRSIHGLDSIYAVLAGA